MAKYGRQPAADLIRQTGYPKTFIGKQIDVHYTHLHNATLGNVAPHPDMVKALAKYLKTKPEDLFSEDALREGQIFQELYPRSIAAKDAK